MTKKRVTTTLFIALVLLTLISFCFLGTTFARYTSGGNGAASVSVADWAIDFGVKGDAVEDVTTVSFNDLSPAQEAYESTARTHSSALTLLATIKNTGDVDALITLTRGETTITKAAGAPVSGSAPDYYDDDTLKALFELKLYVHTAELSAADDQYLQYLWDGSKTYNLPAATNGTLYIYGVATWNTDDEGSASDKGADADEKDTYAGKYVETVSWTLGYKAEQNSEKPV